ncbi:asparaginase [Clostridiaceae bacterium OttesenSCG-928-D20]|nr:asparaginase [Clostridiaceae bacterium OttesenSCG-928-D20]
MKKILLISTGGTIASLPSEGGLEPSLGSGAILKYLTDLSDGFSFEHLELFSLDSSNIQPEQWQTMASAIYENIDSVDGIIITHGTDTMAYTAAALSFMLVGLSKPVVLTGSQVPISNPNSDARVNLCTAIAAIDAGMTGVLLAFNHRIINGTRAVKISTIGFDAFRSINKDDMAKIYADGIRIFTKHTGSIEHKRELKSELSSDVFLLKLIPGTKPEIFDALSRLNYRGIVIEAFGAGGMHYIKRNLYEKLEELCASGITVAVCSQCLYERSDLGIYEVGQRIIKTGAISAEDMTTEAAVTKLMWALGQSREPKEVKRLFYKNLAGELEAAEPILN